VVDRRARQGQLPLRNPAIRPVLKIRPRRWDRFALVLYDLWADNIISVVEEEKLQPPGLVVPTAQKAVRKVFIFLAEQVGVTARCECFDTGHHLVKVALSKIIEGSDASVHGEPRQDDVKRRAHAACRITNPLAVSDQSV
jgi:hypothetical protein